MQTTKQLLDRAKKAQNIESDYKLAQVLGVVQSAVTHWRSGRSSPDDVIAAKLAEMAGQDPFAVIAELHASRAKTADAKQLWMRMANQLRHAVAAVMFAVGAAMLVIAGSPTSAEASTGSSQTQSSPGLCIMLNRVRRVRRAVVRGLRRLLQSLVHGMPDPLPANQSVQPEKDQKDNSRAIAISRTALAAGA